MVKFILIFLAGLFVFMYGLSPNHEFMPIVCVIGAVILLIGRKKILDN